MTRVLVAGSRVRSERSDAETRPLVAALAARGVDAADVPWDDETAGWSDADLVAVRTTWDYTERRDDFLAWASTVAAATRLVNPLPVLTWNSHKRYLVELAEAGVPTVPTVLLGRGSAVPDDLGRGPVVIKPAVSAGGRGTHLGHPDDLRETVAGLLGVGDVLVQPAVESIGRDGEVSLIRLGGTWSHAVRKLPAAGGFLVHEKHGGRLEDHTPTTREVEVAEAALALAPGDVAAARVDLVRVDGEPVVMELELIEPELFLRRATDAPDRLADALLAHL
ncbi:ATP-grasp domain-containing protein [Actinomycetospora flava]|uniref:ATP-grasp domain-containing protein n=1 Tax=Actinomycetospora flava TaxID=3129232 RepID=A0ABU8MGV9_9PSEU